MNSITQLMLQSYTEGAGEVDAEMRAAIRKGYVPNQRPQVINPQLSESLTKELEQALKRILELEEQGSYKNGNSTNDAVQRIVHYLQKQAYLTGTAKRRAAWGENLVLVVYRETGTKECAKYVGRVFIDDVYSYGEALSSNSFGYNSWNAYTGRGRNPRRYPLLSEAINGGLYHYGCKCWHVSYFEGVTDNDYMGEQLPSFVDYTTLSSLGDADDIEDAHESVRSTRTTAEDALVAIRRYLNAHNIDPTRRRGFFARHNVLYQRNVPEALHDRIMAYLTMLLGEGFEDTNEVYTIYHALLNLMASQMLLNADLNPNNLSDDFINAQLYDIFGGRGGDGQKHDATMDDSYVEYRRLYVFMQNFDSGYNIDLATVLRFFSHMDNHANVVTRHTASLDNQRDQIIAEGSTAVREMFHGISDVEAQFLYWAYRWATTSDMTYEMGRRHQSFGLVGAGLIAGGAGVAASASRAFSSGGSSTTTFARRPLQTSPYNSWTVREGWASGGMMSNNANLLRNYNRAQIDTNKITSYALNAQHPVGGDKALVFESALGFNQSNADQLIRQIRHQLSRSEAVTGLRDMYGQRFTVDMQILGPNGRTATVRTGWIFDPGVDVPRLVTLYVK